VRSDDLHVELDQDGDDSDCDAVDPHDAVSIPPQLGEDVVAEIDGDVEDEDEVGYYGEAEDAEGERFEEPEDDDYLSRSEQSGDDAGDGAGDGGAA